MTNMKREENGEGREHEDGQISFPHIWLWLIDSILDISINGRTRSILSIHTERPTPIDLGLFRGDAGEVTEKSCFY